MWDGDGREAGQTSSSAAQRSPDPAQQPPLPDVGRRPEQTDIQGDVPSDLLQWFASDADALPECFPSVPEACSPAWYGTNSNSIVCEYLLYAPPPPPAALR